MPNLSLKTNQSNEKKLVTYQDELTLEVSSRYHTEYIEGIYKKSTRFVMQSITNTNVNERK